MSRQRDRSGPHPLAGVLAACSSQTGDRLLCSSATGRRARRVLRGDEHGDALEVPLVFSARTRHCISVPTSKSRRHCHCRRARGFGMPAAIATQHVGGARSVAGAFDAHGAERPHVRGVADRALERHSACSAGGTTPSRSERMAARRPDFLVSEGASRLGLARAELEDLEARIRAQTRTTARSRASSPPSPTDLRGHLAP